MTVTARKGRRGFDGWRIDPTTSVETGILGHLRENGPSTAWNTAKAINALGATVSSRMHKMWKAGIIEALLEKTPRGGRLYRLPRA